MAVVVSCTLGVFLVAWLPSLFILDGVFVCIGFWVGLPAALSYQYDVDLYLATHPGEQPLPTDVVDVLIRSLGLSARLETAP